MLHSSIQKARKPQNLNFWEKDGKHLKAHSFLLLKENTKNGLLFLKFLWTSSSLTQIQGNVFYPPMVEYFPGFSTRKIVAKPKPTPSISVFISVHFQYFSCPCTSLLLLLSTLYKWKWEMIVLSGCSHEIYLGPVLRRRRWSTNSFHISA